MIKENTNTLIINESLSHSNTISQGDMGEASWGLLGNSIIETYLVNNDERKFNDIAERAMKHSEEDMLPTGKLYDMIKTEDHVFIDWKSRLEIVMNEQYNMTRTCDYSLGN